jgi:fructokinase
VFDIIGIGEILWDLLPGAKKLGGAPANFAYVSNVVGAFVASQTVAMSAFPEEFLI